MGAPAPRSNGSYASSAADLTLNIPGGTNVGDLMIMFLETTPADTAPATPTGWTSFGTAASTGTTAGSPATQTRCQAFYRYAQSGDTSWTITDPGDHCDGVILSFYNVAPTTPHNQVATSNSGTGGQVSGSCVFPTVTTTVKDCLIVYGGSVGWDATSAQFTGGTLTYASALEQGQTRTGNNTNLGNGGGVGTACGAMPSAGAVGTSSWSLAGGSQQWACWTIALAPASQDSIGILVEGGNAQSVT